MFDKAHINKHLFLQITILRLIHIPVMSRIINVERVTKNKSMCQPYQPPKVPDSLTVAQKCITTGLQVVPQKPDLLTLSELLHVPINPDKTFTPEKLKESITLIFAKGAEENNDPYFLEYSFQRRIVLDIFRCVAKTPRSDLTENILSDLLRFFYPDKNDIFSYITYSTLVANISDHCDI